MGSDNEIFNAKQWFRSLTGRLVEAGIGSASALVEMRDQLNPPQRGGIVFRTTR